MVWNLLIVALLCLDHTQSLANVSMEKHCMSFTVRQKLYKGLDITMTTGNSCLLRGKTVLKVLLALNTNHVWVSSEAELYEIWQGDYAVQGDLDAIILFTYFQSF
jgi:hypothetical protein